MALPGIRPMQFDDISTTSSMLPEFNYEDVTLVWLDENVNESFDCLDTKCRLSAIVNYFKVFDNVQETIDYIRSALREHLFLIVSGSLGEMLIANVNDEFQLKFIYVFCMNKEKHSNWSCKYEKICGVFSDKYELFQNLTLQVRTYEKSLLAMSIFNRTRTATVESSTRDYIIEEDIGLMWLLMFFNILLHIPLDKNVAKQDMIAECRLYYNNNPAELKKIDEFENDYSPEMAIKWYTRDSFVYRLVNKALRTLNIDIIFKFRFLIIDLHQQLKQYHTNYIQSVSIMNPKRVMHKVYRSQHMGISKLEKLKTSVGNLICSNSFFSTTDDCLIAQAFVAGSCSSELILFEIEIPDSYYQNDFDALKVSCPFLKIEKLGQFEAENEVIFSLGALFRIESIEQYDIWYVRLKFEGEKDELTSDFHELEELEIGDYDWQTSCNVEDRILLLTEKFPPSSKNILNVYIKHGVFADAKSLTTTETLTTYRKGFELLMKCLPNYNSQITIAMYLSIGLLYCHRGERILAIQFGEVALQLAETCLRFDHDYALICYNYLGVIHRLEDQYTEALSIYEKMLSMAAEQNNTSALLAIYYEICSITCDFGDYDYEMICLVKIVELSRALGCENSKDTYYNFDDDVDQVGLNRGRCVTNETESSIHTNSGILKGINNKFNELTQQLTLNSSRFDQQMNHLNTKIGRMTSTTNINRFAIEPYVDKTGEKFPDKLMHDSTDLLGVLGTDYGDYARNILPILYTKEELQTSILPPGRTHLSRKPLDKVRFKKFTDAMRYKFKLSSVNFGQFYRTLLRRKLTDFLIEERRRDELKLARQSLKSQAKYTSQSDIDEIFN